MLILASLRYLFYLYLVFQCSGETQGQKSLNLNCKEIGVGSFTHNLQIADYVAYIIRQLLYITFLFVWGFPPTPAVPKDYFQHDAGDHVKLGTHMLGIPLQNMLSSLLSYLLSPVLTFTGSVTLIDELCNDNIY